MLAERPSTSAFRQKTITLGCLPSFTRCLIHVCTMRCKFRVLYFCVIILIMNLPVTLRTPLRQCCHSFQVHPLQEKGVRNAEKLNTLLWDCMIKCRWENLYRLIFFCVLYCSVETEPRLDFWSHLTLQFKFSLSCFFEVARKNKWMQSNLFWSSRFQNLTIYMQRDGVQLETESLSITHNTPSWSLTQQKLK